MASIKASHLKISFKRMVHLEYGEGNRTNTVTPRKRNKEWDYGDRKRMAVEHPHSKYNGRDGVTPKPYRGNWRMLYDIEAT